MANPAAENERGWHIDMRVVYIVLICSCIRMQIRYASFGTFYIRAMVIDVHANNTIQTNRGSTTLTPPHGP